MFEVDPFWPKPLPNHWLLGSAIGVSVDAQDHVWIVHRGPSTLQRAHRDRRGRDAADRRVLPRVAARARVRSRRATSSATGAVPGAGYEWPESNHGITVDHKGNVWIGGNGAEGRPRPEVHARTGSSCCRSVAQGKSSGSHDTENFGRVAKIFVDPKANEAYVADGYGNKRVAVIDADTGKFKRYWGAYGNKPDDTNLGPYDPDAPPAQQFRNPVHCAELVERRARLRVRPPERPHPGVPEGRHVREGGLHRQEDAGRRVGVGHRLLEGPAAEVPLPRRRQEREGLHHRSRSRSRSSPPSATAAASPASSSASTASPRTRRATSTRPRPTKGSACRSSSTRASGRFRRRTRARRGRRRRASRVDSAAAGPVGGQPASVLGANSACDVRGACAADGAVRRHPQPAF